MPSSEEVREALEWIVTTPFYSIERRHIHTLAAYCRELHELLRGAHKVLSDVYHAWILSKELSEDATAILVGRCDDTIDEVDNALAKMPEVTQ